VGALAVFEPNLTSELLVRAVRRLDLDSTVEWAELGCGTGWISEQLSKSTPLDLDRAILSDVSPEAVAEASARLRPFSGEVTIRVAPDAKHLAPQSLDLIVCDIAAIADVYAEFYSWYDGVPANCGLDGLDNLRRAVPEAALALRDGASLVLPVLSLSRYQLQVDLLKAWFGEVSISERTEWPLPASPALDALLEQRIMKDHLELPGWRYNRRMAWTAVATCQR